MDMNTKKINVLKPKFRTKEILEQIEECLEKGWTGMGFKTTEFEEAWKEYTNLSNAHFLNSATSGLHLALNLFKSKYNWEDGDEIITTPLTFVSTNHAIMYENLKPVFADVDEYMCLDPKSIEANITKKTKALIYVGVGGNCGNLDVIKNICEVLWVKIYFRWCSYGRNIYKKRIPWSCLPFRACWKTRQMLVYLVFKSVKNLATADSGMICFKEDEDDTKVRKLSWLGIDKDTYARSNQGSYKWKYDVKDVGFKYHGNSIMAAMGLVQLKYLEQDNDKRREIASYYKEKLKEIKSISIVDDNSFIERSSRHLFQILVNPNQRDNIINNFYENNIFPGVHYIDNTNYEMYSYAKGTCPKSHLYSNSLITLPIHLDITQSDIDMVCTVLKNSLT